jgi:arylsulfatase A-like enzyme
VLIDALRADRLGAYGHTRKLTLTMDSIAAQAVLFERAIAPAPWTQPAVASLFCGCYPGVHQVIDFEQAADMAGDRAVKTRILSESFETLAESLCARGYVTAAFVANPFILKECGYAQGFDHFDTSMKGMGVSGKTVTDAAVAWLEQRDTSRPVFVYLHYMDVHGPYRSLPRYFDPLIAQVDAMPEKHLLTEKETRRLEYLVSGQDQSTDPARDDRLRQYREYWVARYESDVAEVDDHLADLRAKLAGMGLWDDAYVIVLADHGEALCEHGHWDHGLSVHHPELHVPLLLRWPGMLPAGVRVAGTVSLIDVFPTLIEQLGLRQVAGLQGRSLLPLIGGEKFTVPAFAEAVKKGAEQKAVYVGDWKVIVGADNTPPMLYNIAADPLEQNDLATGSPDKVKPLADLVQRQVDQNRRMAPGERPPDVPLSPDQIERLKSLGYVE